jgi:hypothetical protein
MKSTLNGLFLLLGIAVSVSTNYPYNQNPAWPR